MSALGRALLGAAGVGALAELTARWWIRRRGGYYRYTPHVRERHEIDREAMPSVPPVAHVEINCDGERGDPPPRDSERSLRALVVGGSAAECYYLDQRDTWPAVAQRVLRQPEQLAALGVSRVHVGNVARAILPCQELELMLRLMLPRYRRLDVVLIMVGASDLVRWMEQGMPDPIPERSPELSRLFEQHPEGPWGVRPSQTALWRIASGLNRRLRRPVVTRPKSGGWLHRVRKMRASAPHLIDVEPDATAMLDHFERNLTALVRTARTRASRVILVRQPWLGAPLSPAAEAMMWNFGLGRPYREEVTTYFTPRIVDQLMRRVDARAVEVAVATGAEQLDLMPWLERSPRTFYDYLHLTPQGAEAVGRAVAAVIAGPVTPGSPAPGQPHQKR